MKNPFIIPTAMICATILAGIWMLKPSSEQPQQVKVVLQHSPQPPEISIHDAALGDNIEAVKQHIAAGTDVDAKTVLEKRTPLLLAATWGHKAIVELLIANGADVNAKDDMLGRTPLHRAAWNGHKEVAELLIAASAPLNAKDKHGFTPLHLAASKDKEIAELLIDAGADVNAKIEVGDFKGQTPLDIATHPNNSNKNKAKIADLLRKHGGKTGKELKAEGK